MYFCASLTGSTGFASVPARGFAGNGAGAGVVAVAGTAGVVSLAAAGFDAAEPALALPLVSVAGGGTGWALFPAVLVAVFAGGVAAAASGAPDDAPAVGGLEEAGAADVADEVDDGEVEEEAPASGAPALCAAGDGFLMLDPSHGNP